MPIAVVCERMRASFILTVLCLLFTVACSSGFGSRSPHATLQANELDAFQEMEGRPRLMRRQDSEDSDDLFQGTEYHGSIIEKNIKGCGKRQVPAVVSSLVTAIKALDVAERRLKNLGDYFDQNEVPDIRTEEDIHLVSTYRIYSTFIERAPVVRGDFYGDGRQDTIDRVDKVRSLAGSIARNLKTRNAGRYPSRTVDDLEIWCSDKWLTRVDSERHKRRNNLWDSRKSITLGTPVRDRWVRVEGSIRPFKQSDNANVPAVLHRGLCGPKTSVLSLNPQHFSLYWIPIADGINPPSPPLRKRFAHKDQVGVNLAVASHARARSKRASRPTSQTPCSTTGRYKERRGTAVQGRPALHNHSLQYGRQQIDANQNVPDAQGVGHNGQKQRSTSFHPPEEKAQFESLRRVRRHEATYNTLSKIETDELNSGIGSQRDTSSADIISSLILHGTLFKRAPPSTADPDREQTEAPKVDDETGMALDDLTDVRYHFTYTTEVPTEHLAQIINHQLPYAFIMAFAELPVTVAPEPLLTSSICLDEVDILNLWQCLRNLAILHPEDAAKNRVSFGYLVLVLYISKDLDWSTGYAQPIENVRYLANPQWVATLRTGGAMA